MLLSIIGDGMKFINNDKNIIVLTYFKLKKNKEFLLYTFEEETKDKIIYFSKIEKDDTKLTLLKPDSEDLPLLQDIIKRFLEQEKELKILKHNNYEFINLDSLNNYQITEEDYQKILLTEEQYIKLLSNKYLTYPELKILNIEEIAKRGYTKNNEEAITASILLLLIYFILIVLYQIILFFMHKPITSIFELNGPSIIMWSLVVALISMAAFNFEEKDYKESWIVIFFTILFYIGGLTLIQNNNSILNALLLSFMYSITFTVPYVLAKRISFYFVNRYKCRNYLTYYVFYLISFVPIIALMILIQNKILEPFISTLIS